MHHRSYHWLHIHTGKTGEEEFTEVQYAEAGVERFQCGGLGIPSPQAFALMNKWDASSSLWKYWV